MGIKVRPVVLEPQQGRAAGSGLQWSPRHAAGRGKPYRPWRRTKLAPVKALSRRPRLGWQRGGARPQGKGNRA